jgi:dipeptidyl aminopeptidase/acylaminoacyl peptidase
MNLPALNPGGYINASISNVTAFDKVDYLLAHGTGDDNVHFANSAHLLDMFTKEHIRNYQFRMFTDRCAGHGFLEEAPRVDVSDFTHCTVVIMASRCVERTGSSTSI